MKAELINTAKEHTAALARVYELVQQDPRAGSLEAEELEKLALLVSDYEDKYFPVPPPEHTNNR